MCNTYVSIHTHSMYSVLDGLPSIDALIGKAKALGMPAMALTDHGAMYGVYEFYKKAKAAGIKPILGTEAYLNAWGLGIKDRTTRDPYHLLLLAMNNTGYKNLMRISSIAQTEGFYYKPRIDHSVLKEHGEGVICTSGCLASELPRLINNDKQEEAEKRLQWYLDVFGDRFYLELQDHDIPELYAVNEVLASWSSKYGIPLVATNDVHYVEQSDSIPHDYFLCVQTQSKLNDEDRMKMNNDSYFLRNFEEMANLFVPEALSNTVDLANRCDVSIDSKGYHLPSFSIPVTGFLNHFEYLRYLVGKGFEKKYGIGLDIPSVDEKISLDPYTTKEENYAHKDMEPDLLRARVDYELGVIKAMKFEKYFLVVWDILDYARKNNILWSVRGSAAGSIVSYCLGLTSVEPVSNGLYFERFLNPDRVSMPDIDMDFPDDQRPALIDYTVDKYGVDCVSQIITFGTMQSRAAIKDVARVISMPLPEANKLVDMIPDAPNKQTGLQNILAESDELKSAYGQPENRRVLDMAIKLEGSIRNVGTHAAGVVIADAPIIEYVPLHRISGKPLSEKIKHVTQFEMGHLEEMGLLKMDYLGLKTLSVMREAIKTINQNHGKSIVMDHIPIHSEEIYALMRAGNTLGVFQLEGGGMTKVLVEMQPTKYEHIVACISLFRPGPMEYIPQYIRRLKGEEQVEYRHPDTEHALAETFGIIVYQESIMTLARDIAGYSASEADTIRKAVGKKDTQALFKHREKFISGAVAKGYPQELGRDIFADIEFFARYGFNKAHAAAYALLSCRTAWLKANYPLEYMCAYLNSEYEDKEKVNQIISETRRAGFAVGKPDINISEKSFAVKRGAIVFGLKGIKGLGEKAIDALLEKRKDGIYTSVEDIVMRGGANRAHLEALIVSGALDTMGYRRYLLGGIDSIIKEKNRVNKLKLSEFSGDLFGEEERKEEITMIDRNEKIDPELFALENDTIGHNFVPSTDEDLFDRFKELADKKVKDLIEPNIRGSVAVRIGNAKEITTKTGKAMAFVEMEDNTGKGEIVFFPEEWAQFKSVIESGKGSIFIVSGRSEASRDGMGKMIAKTVKNVSGMLEETKKKLVVFFDTEDEIFQFINSLRAGRDTVFVCIGLNKKTVENKEIPAQFS